ncbi:MAG: GTP-binding protein, partial [Bacteroidetes bacterium HGW-Bacteroidetes-15]
MRLVKSKQPCPKCGGKDFIFGELYMAGSLFTKLFNIQNRKF